MTEGARISTEGSALREAWGAVILLAATDHQNERPAFRTHLKRAIHHAARTAGWATTRGRGARRRHLAALFSVVRHAVDLAPIVRRELRYVQQCLADLHAQGITTPKGVRAYLESEGVRVSTATMRRLGDAFGAARDRPLDVLARLRAVEPASVKRAMARGRSRRHIYLPRLDVSI